MASRRSWILGGLVVVGLLAVAFLTLPITLTPSVRNRLLAALNERFDSRVDLTSLRVSVLPRIRVAGEGLTLHHKGRTDVPPLIAIGAFSAEASLFGLVGGPLHLSRVQLTGLQINIPPGGLKMRGASPATPPAAPSASTPATSTPSASSPAPAPASASPARRAGRSPLIVDELLSEAAELRILRREPEKAPRVFEIHHLTMRDVGADTPWAFRTTLRNPTPPGDIQTEGTFGPWAAGVPSNTPLTGKYTFNNADLGVFKGIAGILTSDGTFSGVLERIEVDGRTTTPDFRLTSGGQPVPLTTKFHATVDGTNGNTWLKPVNATLGQSQVDTSGGVVETEGVKGRTVSLDVAMHDARIEDVLRLAIASAAKSPPLTGQLTLDTKFVLPPGQADVIQKLQLDGSFHIAKARFPSGGVQAKINELSRRGRGELDDPARNVASDLRGRFVMKQGTIRFSSITFGVPGARIALAGTYTLRGEQMDFTGQARLEAKLSEMTTGYKSVLLKAVDPLFRRQGGTVIPINIRGTVDHPKFGVDVKRVLTRR